MHDNGRGDYVVSYDIANSRRLMRVHRYLRAWGVPLQRSVFFCRLNQRERRLLIEELLERIDVKADDVRIYGVRATGMTRYPDSGSDTFWKF